MGEKYTVSQIAKLNNINSRTIRYFDSVDLFKPSFCDVDNGYRYYYIDKIEELDTIMYLRYLKIPISDIKEILHTKNKDVYEEKLKSQLNFVDNEIKKLREIKSKINAKLNDSISIDIDELERVEIRNFPERKVYKIDCKVEKDEDIISALGKSKIRSMGEIIAYGNVSISLAKNKLINRNYKKYDNVVVLNQTGYTNDVLKACKYAVIRFVGGHVDAYIRYDRILDYLSKNNYKIIGNSIERKIFTHKIISQEAYLITEIQVPIE